MEFPAVRRAQLPHRQRIEPGDQQRDPDSERGAAVLDEVEQQEALPG